MSGSAFATALKGGIMEQLSFLTDETNTRLELDVLKNQLDNLRRGFFKRHNLMEKEIEELKREISILKGEEPKEIEIDMFASIMDE